MKKRNIYMIASAILTAGLAIPLSLSAATMHKPARAAGAIPTGPKIRVLLERDAKSAFLEAKGSYRVIRRDDGSSLSSGKLGKRFVVHAIQDGLRWGEEYPDIYQIEIVPLNKDTTFLVNGIQYTGSISIYHVRGDQIAIVNELPIEDFIKSTLTIKFEESLSTEAMAAIAIAARTEAYQKMLQGRKALRPWDITASEMGYYGTGMLHQKNGVEPAVDWTRFMVLESLKQEGPISNSFLIPDRAEELAKKGLDAQKILKSAFPQAKIAATIDPDEVSVR
jgi:hypothetical protein